MINVAVSGVVYRVYYVVANEYPLRPVTNNQTISVQVTSGKSSFNNNNNSGSSGSRICGFVLGIVCLLALLY